MVVVKMMPVSHVLIPFFIGLIVLTLVRRRNILFDRDRIDEFILFGLALGGFFPDVDSIRYLGLEHREILHEWWMLVLIGLIIYGVGYARRSRNVRVFSLAFILGSLSHLVLDFRTRQILYGVQVLADKILNVKLQNEAEMMIDGVIILVIVLYILSKAIFMRGGE